MRDRGICGDGSVPEGRTQGSGRSGELTAVTLVLLKEQLVHVSIRGRRNIRINVYMRVLVKFVSTARRTRVHVGRERRR
jgi:hypothetical protein